MAPLATATIPRKAPASKTRRARIVPGVASPAWEPLVRPGFISRSNLLRALEDAPTPGVVAVIAPPGYGKSTVLDEWARRDPRHFVSLPAAELADDDGQLTATRA